MLQYLRALARRIAQRGFPPLFPPLEDPELGVREPRRRGPGGKSSAVAVSEPIEKEFVRACGRVSTSGVTRRHTDS